MVSPFRGLTKCGPCQHLAVANRIAPHRHDHAGARTFASAVMELVEQRRRALGQKRSGSLSGAAEGLYGPAVTGGWRGPPLFSDLSA
jgi:hypothetical protein